MSRRRLWKTFYISDGRERGRLQEVWQSWPVTPKTNVFDIQVGFIETNLPLTELRDLFRIADVKWRDYVSDIERVG